MYYRSFLWVLTCFLLSVSASFAQDSMGQAGALVREGKLTDAILKYDEILASNGQHREARIARGFAYAWKHQFEKAREDFKLVEQQDPGNPEAEKGLAYVELWCGQFKQASVSFTRLIQKNPTKEFYTAQGLSFMNAGELKAARVAFVQAAKMDPADIEIPRLINAIRTKPGIVEIDVIGGYASAGNFSKTGLRLLQVSSQLSPRVNLSAKYDNSLSIDNGGLILRQQAVPYYAGSLLYNWNGKALTRGEIGVRNGSMATGISFTRETQISLEQVIFLGKGKSIKAGAAFMLPDSGRTAILMMAGYRQPIHEKITAGLGYFLASRGAGSQQEHRILADADFRFRKGASLNTGFYFGSISQIQKTNGSGSRTVTGGFLRGYIPLNHWLGLHLGMAIENNPIQDLLNANAGVRIRFEK